MNQKEYYCIQGNVIFLVLVLEPLEQLQHCRVIFSNSAEV